MSMQSTRFVLVSVSLLLAFTCLNRHSIFVSGHISTTGALLAIGCLQPPTSLASHVSSASLQLLHRYTSVLVGVAILGQHAAEAKLEVVTERNFKETTYYRSSVSLKGENDILITLDNRTRDASVTWKFNSSNYWQIQLDKCANGYPIAGIEISDSCKWKFVWYEETEFRLSAGKEYTWKFPTTNPTTAIRKLRAQIVNNPPNPPTMGICVIHDNGNCQTIITPGSMPPSLEKPDYCMLSTGVFNVNMTNTQPSCPTNMDAQLLYDFYESTAMPSTTQNGTKSLPVWTGSGPAPSGYATRSLPPSSSEPTTPSPGLATWAIVSASVGGLLLIAAIVGAVIAFICIRRRRRPKEPQEHYDDDGNPDMAEQIEKEEGLIEWEGLMAHAPYEPMRIIHRLQEDWPYMKGDTVDLSSIAASECSKVQFKELEFKGNIKGTEDYGVVEGRFDPKDKTKGVNREASIYYSFRSDRVKAFVDRLSRLTQLYQPGKDAADEAYKEKVKKVKEENKKKKEENKRRKQEHEDKPLPLQDYFPLLRVPELRYFWISPDPAKFSYLVVHRNGWSVAQMVKDGKLAFHQRFGLTFTTFAALTSIHRLGCVHRDVTPAAFMIRNEKPGDFNFVYISHLCLSRFQYNITDNTWMPRRRVVTYFGTHKYASRAAHAQQERSFKDDVESWFYTAVELIWPTRDDKLFMPWHLFNAEIGVTDRKELHKKYKEAKDSFLRTFIQNKMFVTFPAAQFRVFADEIVKMKFETLESDYGTTFINFLRVMIEQLPVQADEASHQAVLDHIWNLNEYGCHVDRKFKFGPEVDRSAKKSDNEKKPE